MPAIRIVVDASVARAAGGLNGTAPVSVLSRGVLDEIRAAGLHLAMSPDILAEWRRHRSRYASVWLHDMYGRKRVKRIEPASEDVAREAIGRCSEKKRLAMEKDLLLLEAALAADQRVISLDEVVRELFASLSHSVGSIAHILWNCPLSADCVEWIRSGTPDVLELRLRAT